MWLKLNDQRPGDLTGQVFVPTVTNEPDGDWKKHVQKTKKHKTALFTHKDKLMPLKLDMQH